MTKKEIKVINATEEDKEYIRALSVDLMEDEMLNEGIFGDEDRLDKVKRINQLEPWKRNLLFLYVKYGSLKKVENVLNVKASHINKVINEIKKEILS